MTYPPPPVSEDEEEKPGDSFTGDMQHGKRSGVGTYTWSSGAKFTGEYADGLKQGDGTMVYPDGSSYVGNDPFPCSCALPLRYLECCASS